jgi:hypothetical protein
LIRERWDLEASMQISQSVKLIVVNILPALKQRSFHGLKPKTLWPEGVKPNPSGLGYKPFTVCEANNALA